MEEVDKAYSQTKNSNRSVDTVHQQVQLKSNLDIFSADLNLPCDRQLLIYYFFEHSKHNYLTLTKWLEDVHL